jgi:hypothetical protein
VAKVKKFGSTPRETNTQLDDKLTPKPFTLVGEDFVYTATPPKESIWQRVRLAGRPNAPIERRVQALLDFVHGVLADSGEAERVSERLLSGADTLDLVDVFPVVRYLSDAWSAEAVGGQVWADFQAEHGLLDDDADADGTQKQDAGASAGQAPAASEAGAQGTETGAGAGAEAAQESAAA